MVTPSIEANMTSSSDQICSQAREYYDDERHEKHPLLNCFPFKRKKRRHNETKQKKFKSKLRRKGQTNPEDINSVDQSKACENSSIEFAPPAYPSIDQNRQPTHHIGQDNDCSPTSPHRCEASKLISSREDCVAYETDHHPLSQAGQPHEQSTSSAEVEFEQPENFNNPLNPNNSPNSNNPPSPNNSPNSNNSPNFNNSNNPTNVAYYFHCCPIANLNTSDICHYHVMAPQKNLDTYHSFYLSNYVDLSSNTLQENRFSHGDMLERHQSKSDKGKREFSGKYCPKCKQEFTDSDFSKNEKTNSYTFPLRKKSSRKINFSLPSSKAFMTCDSSWKVNGEQIEMKIIKRISRSKLQCDGA